MQQFNYDITLNCATETEAETKMKAVVTLAKFLSSGELERLAHIVQHDPVKTALAKQYLNM